MRQRLILTVFLLFFAPLAFSQTKPASPSGFIDLNYYYDTRDFTTATINLLASFPSGFEYFSLVDYSGIPNESLAKETEIYYTEQNMRWPVRSGQPFSISSQWVGQSGPQSDMLRLGALVRLSEFEIFREHLDGSLNSFSINLFPLQLDNNNEFNWQIEYFYRFQFMPSFFEDRFYLSGFADQNLDSRGTSKWVTEHQFGIQIVKQFYVAVEFRYNEFLASKREGIGLGLQYVIKF